MSSEKERFQRWANIHRDTLLDDVIPFWTRYSVDREYGGFLTLLDRKGEVYGTDKAVWLQGRIGWLFAKLYNDVEARDEWLELSRHAVDFLLKHAFDTDGRMFFLLDRSGRPVRKRRYLFSENFAIIALAEYGKASGHKQYVDRANQVYDLMLRYYRTPGLLEPKDIQETRPSKGHAMPMILLATTAVLRQASEPRDLYQEVVDDSLAQIFGHFFQPEMDALLETVGPNGEFMDTPEGRTVNPGHAIETSWFVMEEGLARGDLDLAHRALPILDCSLRRGWDPTYGGILYFVDVHDKPCVQYEWDMKLWWPHVEAMIATLHAYRLTGDRKWLDWYEKVHDYAYDRFGDPEFGEWFGYLHRDGSVSHTIKGNIWKGPFHLSRALLRCWKLCEELAEKA